MSISDIKHKSEIQLTISQAIFFENQATNLQSGGISADFPPPIPLDSVQAKQGARDAAITATFVAGSNESQQRTGSSWEIADIKLLFRILSINDKTNLF